MELLMELVLRGRPYVPSIVAVVAVVIGLIVANRLLSRRYAEKEDAQFRQQMIMLSLTVVALLIVVTMLPIADSTKGQLLSLLGLVLSAAIALSATTFLGNALAGVMMRSVGGFRIGDFVRVEKHFGRVTERGLFHTEIQNEMRELITLPNLFMVTHPMTTLRSSGTIVTGSVSLGYDVPRGKVEELLLQAASDAELEEPFVQISSLGDFSVVYRVAGLLKDVKRLITARSQLKGKMLDRLHEGGVEIVSPNFMNTRALREGVTFIPGSGEAPPPPPPDQGALPEERIFDKAEEAEKIDAAKGEAGDRGGGNEET